MISDFTTWTAWKAWSSFPTSILTLPWLTHHTEMAPEMRGGVLEQVRGTVRQVQEFRGGWHGKQKYHLGTHPTEERQTTGRDMGLCELAERGRRNSQKNHYVGCCPGKRIFHRAFSHLTESNNLGRELFRSSADTVFLDMAKDQYPGIVQYGNV